MGTHVVATGPNLARTMVPKKFQNYCLQWFNGIWCAHELFQQFSTLYRSKTEYFAKKIDIVTTHDDETCYVKHVLDPLCVFFFTLFGCWGEGVMGGWGTTCLRSFPALAAQEWKFPKLIFLIL